MPLSGFPYMRNTFLTVSYPPPSPYRCGMRKLHGFMQKVHCTRFPRQGSLHTWQTLLSRCCLFRLVLYVLLFSISFHCVMVVYCILITPRFTLSEPVWCMFSLCYNRCAHVHTYVPSSMQSWGSVYQHVLSAASESIPGVSKLHPQAQQLWRRGNLDAAYEYSYLLPYVSTCGVQIMNN